MSKFMLPLVILAVLVLVGLQCRWIEKIAKSFKEGGLLWTWRHNVTDTWCTCRKIRKRCKASELYRTTMKSDFWGNLKSKSATSELWKALLGPIISIIMTVLWVDSCVLSRCHWLWFLTGTALTICVWCWMFANIGFITKILLEADAAGLQAVWKERRKETDEAALARKAEKAAAERAAIAKMAADLAKKEAAAKAAKEKAKAAKTEPATETPSDTPAAETPPSAPAAGSRRRIVDLR